jgi:hypothetical protein
MRVPLPTFFGPAIAVAAAAVALLALLAVTPAAASSLANNPSDCKFQFGTNSNYLLTAKDGFKIECPESMQTRVYRDCGLPTPPSRLQYNCNATPFGYMTITVVAGSEANKECAGEALKELVTKKGVPTCKTVSKASPSSFFLSANHPSQAAFVSFLWPWSSRCVVRSYFLPCSSNFSCLVQTSSLSVFLYFSLSFFYFFFTHFTSISITFI